MNKFGKITIKTYDNVVAIKSLGYTFQSKQEIKLTDIEEFVNGNKYFRRMFLISIYEECVIPKKRINVKYDGGKYTIDEYINSMTILYLFASQHSLDVHYTIKNVNIELLTTLQTLLKSELIYLKHLSKINMLTLNKSVANLLFAHNDIAMMNYNGALQDESYTFDLNFFIKELNLNYIKTNFFNLCYLLKYDILTLDSYEYEESIDSIKTFIVNNQFYIKSLVSKRLDDAIAITTTTHSKTVKNEQLSGFKSFLVKMIDDIKRNDTDKNIVSIYNEHNISSMYRSTESTDIITELLPNILYTKDEFTNIVRTFQPYSTEVVELFNKLHTLLNEAFKDYGSVE